MQLKLYDSTWKIFEKYLFQLPPTLGTLHLHLTHAPGSYLVKERTIDVGRVFSFKELRRLHIDHFKTNSHASAFQRTACLYNLVDLSLSYVQLEWEDIISILRLCPNLENLTMVRSIPASTPALTGRNGTSSPRIPMKRLRNLKIHMERLSTIHEFIQHLDIPSTTNFDLKCVFHMSQHFRSFQDYLILFQSYFNRHDQCQKLHITLTKLILLFWTESVQTDANGHRITVTTKFMIKHAWLRWFKSWDEFCLYLIQIIRETHWRTANSFHFIFDSNNDIITKDSWAQILDSFDDLISFDITLLRATNAAQLEVANAFEVYSERRISRPFLTNISFRLAECNIEFFKALGRSLECMKNASQEISELLIKYNGQLPSAAVQDISGCVRQLQIQRGDIMPDNSLIRY